MIAWGHEITEFGENEVNKLIGQEIVACQIAEGGAMGYHGGVFLVSSSGELFFTCLLEPSNYSGNKKHTPIHVLCEYFPPLMEFECGLMGWGVESPSGFKHIYLGMGNHLLVKDCVYQQFHELASANLKKHPKSILYNRWMDVICDVLEKERG